jgi:phosphopantetheinyl transferase
MEWLAGRIAAKYAAVKLCLPLENLPREHQVEWKKWEVAPDANGRPFLKTKGKIPGISISHSDGKAVAMAASCGTCGIDIQKISSRISKIESKFIDTNEKKFRRNDCLANFSDETFLTLVWSAKEALRKGSGFQPVIGFMEMTLVSVSGSRDSGLVFQFACTRNARKGQKRQIFTTCQAVCDDFALSIFYSPVPL